MLDMKKAQELQFAKTQAETAKMQAEADKTFDESMTTLLQMLKQAVEDDRMSHDEANEYFKEQLDKRGKPGESVTSPFE